MPAATVLIPTHSHAEPLRIAAASVLQQTLTDFELFIVGDGVKDETRVVATEIAAADSRVRFFDFPKAPRKGEDLRHRAINEASGRIVAYLGDDDVWMPWHLETLDKFLVDVDFGHTVHIGFNQNGRLAPRAANLADPAFKAKMLGKFFNCFDMTFAGHTLEAYRRLPRGWETTPPDFPWIDLYMWRKFLAEPWCRSASLIMPTAICTQTHLRPDMSDAERADELAKLMRQFAKRRYREDVWEMVATSFNRQLLKERAKSGTDED